jgi:hypothetical protein
MTGEQIGHCFSLAIAAGVLTVGACQVLSPSIDLAACIAHRAIEGEGIPQIAEDCRTDIATVVQAVLRSEDPAVRKSMAHMESMQLRTMLMTVDAGASE